MSIKVLRVEPSGIAARRTARHRQKWDSRLHEDDGTAWARPRTHKRTLRQRWLCSRRRSALQAKPTLRRRPSSRWASNPDRATCPPRLADGAARRICADHRWSALRARWRLVRAFRSRSIITQVTGKLQKSVAGPPGAFGPQTSGHPRVLRGTNSSAGILPSRPASEVWTGATQILQDMASDRSVLCRPPRAQASDLVKRTDAKSDSRRHVHPMDQYGARRIAKMEMPSNSIFRTWRPSARVHQWV